MPVFVTYDGPKLGNKQKKPVRTQVMVLVRGQQKQAKCQAKSAHLSDEAPPPKNGGRMVVSVPEDDDDMHAQHAQVTLQAATGSSQSHQQAANSSHKRDMAIQPRQQRLTCLNPCDLRGAPPQYTHMTGVDARTFQDYLCRCGSYSSYLDEAFILIGFKQQNYFRPDLSKAACIYIGWLLTAGAVRTLQSFIDGAGHRELHEVVYSVVILAMFEMFRFSPRAVTHLSAVESFLKTRGGLHKMPDVMQHLVIMGDTLQCLCLGTPPAFNTLGLGPIMRLITADGFLAGDQLRSCPLLLCDNEDLSLAAHYVNPAIRFPLVGVLQAASDLFRQFFHSGGQGRVGKEDGPAMDMDLDAVAGGPSVANSVPRRLLQTCALTARIMRRTLSGHFDGFDDSRNESDVLGVYDNARFIGLKAWAGLPYVYVWVNLIGFAATTDGRMRSYFVAEVVRCAFSYGCYQMEVFQAAVGNFLHLRGALLSQLAKRLLMKLSALCLAGFAAGTFGKCITKPCTGQCVAAVAEVGEAFCSSYLSLEPATATVTETATVTSFQTNIETSYDVVTLTTLTTTITGPATTIYAKREEPSADPASHMLPRCGNAASRVSSACSCILSTPSIVTLVETVTATEATEATATTTATITSGATATEYATPTVTVSQPIVNGNFEGYLTTRNILPWTTSGTGGRIEAVNGVNPCSAGAAYCAGGQVVVRTYPPTTGSGYVSLQESFIAKASSTYSLSFMYRCLNYDASTRIDVYFAGARIGTTNACVPGAAFSRVTSGMQFTTDETGAGLLEIRFVNPSNLPYLYFYADDFQAKRVQ
ncbi:hypothetical protein N657DRAFT_674491 [Parathielavia appendiculata]|uniref:Uncharacterized protein n=1 Tax=Parathielavia appendiculata TaxID=2587402 RepID=A0AAN6TT40_9PEZI|nr:hypothetical protein N657DRAFT_674491 [Parathielavia appendiculata]